MNTFKVGDEVVVKRESVKLRLTRDSFGLADEMREAAERQYPLEVVRLNGEAVDVKHVSFWGSYIFHHDELQHYFLNLENE